MAIRSCMVLVLFFILIVADAKKIYVSHDRYSNDTIACGDINQPCYSLQHAVDVAYDWDTILLDGNYIFHLKEPLIVTNNINITSFRSAKYSFIYSKAEYCIFQLSANLSLSKINITYDFRTFSDLSVPILFILNSHYGNINVADCLVHFLLKNPTFAFKQMLYYIDFRIEEKQDAVWSLIFERTNFHVNYFHHVSAIRIKKRSRSSKVELSWDHQYVSVSFKICDFNTTTLYIFARTTNVDGCSLLDSRLEIEGYYLRSTLYLTDSNFDHSMVSFSYKQQYPDIRLVAAIYNVTFDGSNQADVFSYGFQLQVYGNSHREGDINIDSCIFKNSLFGSVNLRNIFAEFNNTIFFDNVVVNKLFLSTDRAAALTSVGSAVILRICSFNNNSAHLPSVGSIYLDFLTFNRPTVTFKMINTNIMSGNHFSEVENTPIMVPPNFNVPQGLAVFSFLNVSIKCPINSFKSQNLLNNRYIILNCIRCKGSTYNANKHAQLTWDGKAGDYIEENTTCYKCPNEASCIGNIRSKGNYWGYANNSGGVHFILCPPSYCCSSLSTCTSYNTCMNNRTGQLCGGCLPGNSISLFGPNKCIQTEKCKSKSFWIFYIVAAVFCCLFFMYYKDVFLIIKSIPICVKCKSVQPTEDDNVNNDGMTSYLLLPEENPIKVVFPPQGSLISGLLKIIFFFYQTASIIRVDASAKNEYTMPLVIGALSSFFNIKIDIKSSSMINICPLQTDNVVLIEFIRTSFLFTCIILCSILTSVLRLILMFLDDEKHAQIITKLQAFLLRLKGAYVQFLLLGYAVTTMFLFQSINCVNIKGESYLYVQAENTRCYQPWQITIMTVIALWIVPFPFAIYISCRLLRSSRITSYQFLLSLTFPLITFYFVMKARSKFEYDDPTAEHILQILNEPFKTLENGHHLVWEPMLLYRRLVLIICTTFILSPVQKLYPVGVFLLIFTAQDAISQPYTEKILNTLQLITFQLLGLFTLVNLFWAFSNDLNFAEDANLKKLGQIFLFFEIFVLMLPFILCFIYIFFYKIGKSFYKLICKKQD